MLFNVLLRKLNMYEVLGRGANIAIKRFAFFFSSSLLIFSSSIFKQSATFFSSSISLREITKKKKRKENTRRKKGRIEKQINCQRISDSNGC